MSYIEILLLLFLCGCMPLIILGIVGYISCYAKPKRPSRQALMLEMEILLNENYILRKRNAELQAELRGRSLERTKQTILH